MKNYIQIGSGTKYFLFRIDFKNRYIRLWTILFPLFKIERKRTGLNYYKFFIPFKAVIIQIGRGAIFQFENVYFWNILKNCSVKEVGVFKLLLENKKDSKYMLELVNEIDRIKLQNTVDDKDYKIRKDNMINENKRLIELIEKYGTMNQYKKVDKIKNVLTKKILKLK